MGIYQEYEGKFVKMWGKWGASFSRGEQAPNFLKGEKLILLTPLLWEKVEEKFPNAQNWARVKDQNLQFQSQHPRIQQPHALASTSLVEPSKTNGNEKGN